MWPKEVPTFKASDILVGKDLDEYRDGEKATVIGWLNECVLYGPPETEIVTITPQDLKDYDKAVSIFRKHAGLKRGEELDFWEETVKPRQAAKWLNATMKELGYE